MLEKSALQLLETLKTAAPSTATTAQD